MAYHVIALSPSISALKILVNTNKDASLKFRLQEARIINTALQQYWKLVVERLYHIIPWLGGHMRFGEGGNIFMNAIL